LSNLRSRHQMGIALLEVLIALAIVSLGMMAAQGQLSGFARTAYYMKKKSLASWIASNKVTEFSLAPRWPEIGDTAGNIEFADLEWHWEAVVEATQVVNLRRVNVSVSLAETPDKVVHEVFGLVEPPPPPGIGFSGWQALPQPSEGETS
jgi:general secretion pathway protein I